MKDVLALDEVREEPRFGAKAVGLGDALRAGLPVPPGVGLSGSIVEAVASDDERAITELKQLLADLDAPLAVRSSAVDEDSAAASFAGQHTTILNVPSADAVPKAVREIWWSANSDSAITYRQRVGLFARPTVGVVVQTLLDPQTAGVMFTRDPVSGSDERVIEASWGLGEAVVAGLVIPDRFRISPSGEVLERAPGLKKIAVRNAGDGGTVEQAIDPELTERLCLDDAQLEALNELAAKCEEIYGPARDIEFAFADGRLYLLQCRAVTKTATSRWAGVSPASTDAVAQVPLFSDLAAPEKDALRKLFKERTFSAGETIAKEGAGGATFFVIASGEATVSVQGRHLATLTAGDHFGEMALVDEGARSATVVAATDLVCHGLTLWEFRPLVESNPAIAWTLLQTLAKRLREAQQLPVESR